MKKQNIVQKKEVNLIELQNALLDILIDIHEVCEKHNIKYSLGFGTALGAVRHHGFIPWDDDVDLIFMREEYERFLDVAECELPKLGYYVQREFSEKWPMSYSKIRKNKTAYIENFSSKIEGLHQGIFVDIFPIDNMYNTGVMREMQWRAYQLVCANGLRKRGYETNSFVKHFAMRISRIFNTKLLVKICKAPDKSNSKYVNVFLGSATRKKESIYRREVFDNYTKIEFEGKYFNIINKYDEYLTTTYGDYMQLPPVEQREASIHALYISLDESYENFVP